MKVIDYQFYKVYRLINFFGNTDFYPEANAWLISSILIWLNLLTFLNILELKLERSLTNSIYVILFYFLYLILSYLYFFKRNRYINILKYYGKEPVQKRFWGSLGVSIYVIASVISHLYYSEQRRSILFGIHE